MKLRIVTTLARILSKPDRTSARSLDFKLTSSNSILSPKQIKLAKCAYDRGLFDVPKRIGVSALAEQVGLARATISEHLARIEAIIMDDMFSSFDEPYVDPETIRLMLDTVELDAQEANTDQKKGMKRMLENIRDNIKNEIAPNILHDDKEIPSSMDDLVEYGMQEHKENISQIDQIMVEKFSSLD